MIESIEYKNISFQYPNQQKKLFENFMNNPASVSLLSGGRKPQIRY